MSVTKRGKAWGAGLLAGALIGGGIALVTPAGAAVQGAAAAIDWKQVWKSEIKPRADKRYYTKKKSNQRYYTKTQVATLLGPYVDTPELVGALAGYYTKAQSDANYYTKTQSDANYYTKAQGDAKYAPYPKLIRGVYVIDVPSGGNLSVPISFGETLSAAPIGHYIPLAGAVPAGCLGTVSAPDALPGHLCVFEGGKLNVTSVLFATPANGIGTSAFGAALIGSITTPANPAYIQGSWAVRPVTVTTPAKPGSAGGVNNPAPNAGGTR